MSYFPFHIWDVILPIDELIFFKMVIAPPTSMYIYIYTYNKCLLMWIEPSIICVYIYICTNHNPLAFFFLCGVSCHSSLHMALLCRWRHHDFPLDQVAVSYSEAEDRGGGSKRIP